jgi:SAM-dependent methyltransferase
MRCKIMNTNINKILKYSKKPTLFDKGTHPLWTEPHISKYMLEAHLNPEWDAASRKTATIDKTVNWINQNFLKPGSSILDLGCGPGLYARRLAQLGHSVTGMDFSRRSIDYAMKDREENNLDIKYIYQSYLEMDYHNEFDLIMIIYCDFGALTNDERNILLKKVHTALKPGGVFIFDVFTDEFAKEIDTKRIWEASENDFWCKDKHVVLSQGFHYPEDKVYLDQNIVITEDGDFRVYRTYDHYYSENDLAELLDGFGFKNHGFFFDVVSGVDFGSSEVVFGVTRK